MPTKQKTVYINNTPESSVCLHFLQFSFFKVQQANTAVGGMLLANMERTGEQTRYSPIDCNLFDLKCF